MKTNCKKWFKENNKILGVCLVTFVFTCIIISCLYYTITASKTCEVKTTDIDVKVWKGVSKEISTRGKSRIKSGNGCNCYSGCEIECQSVDELFLEQHIEQAAEINNCIRINLIVKNTNFPSDLIPVGWLKDLTQQIEILTFQECHFKKIEPGAFDSRTFENLQAITIEESRVKFIAKGAFRGLKNVGTFSFVFNGKGEVMDLQIENGTFDDLPLIFSLRIQYCISNPQTILNIGGVDGSNLPQLQIVDLSHNFLERIEAGSFGKAKMVRSLYLNDNLLNYFDKDALKGTQVQSVYLQNNDLETLEEGVFDYISTEHYTGMIKLSGNPWKCDCDLQWLKDYYFSDENLINDTLLCDNLYLFEEVEFCPTTNSPPKTTTTEITTKSSSIKTTTTTETTKETEITTELSTTTTTTTEPTTTTATTTTETTTTTEPTTIKEPTTQPYSHCKDLSLSGFPIVIDAERNYMEKKVVELNNERIGLEVYNLEYEINTEIAIKGNASNYNLIWINTNNLDDHFCYSNTPPKFLVENLQRNETYTMCFIKNGESTVSPYSCFGAKIMEEWGKRTWIKNEDRILVIALSVTFILISMILSGILVFFCIRQNPKLISGNKRVIMVGTKETEAIILPKNHDIPVYITPIPSAPSEPQTPSGYMTPKLPIYERIHKKYNSIQKNFGEYINKEKLKESNVKKDDLSPPPLPPFHPSEKKKYFNYQEEPEDYYCIEDHYSVVHLK